jgi:hypothetical protein
MIKPKSPEPGVWKLNQRRWYGSHVKPTSMMLLERYVQQRDEIALRGTRSIFNSLGDSQSSLYSDGRVSPMRQEWRRRGDAGKRPGYPQHQVFWVRHRFDQPEEHVVHHRPNHLNSVKKLGDTGPGGKPRRDQGKGSHAKCTNGRKIMLSWSDGTVLFTP